MINKKTRNKSYIAKKETKKLEIILLTGSFREETSESSFSQPVYLARAYPGRGVWIISPDYKNIRDYRKLKGFLLDKFDYTSPTKLPKIEQEDNSLDKDYENEPAKIHIRKKYIGIKKCIEFLKGRWLPYRYILEDEKDPIRFLSRHAEIDNLEKMRKDNRYRVYIMRAMDTLKKMKKRFF